jgi:hypothetical protein
LKETIERNEKDKPISDCRNGPKGAEENCPFRAIQELLEKSHPR